jgi:2,4-dienoyl-CoA reductase-like NADH-dependent reductase (Old Yellow Enzyme family)
VSFGSNGRVTLFAAIKLFQSGYRIDGSEGLNFAGWAKKVTGATTISVGSVGLSGGAIAAFSGESSKPTSLAPLILRLERGEFDLIAVGRPLLADPLWAQKVHRSAYGEISGFSPSAMRELI